MSREGLPDDDLFVEVHAWYMAKPERTQLDAAMELDVAQHTLQNRWKRLGLPSKERKGGVRRLHPHEGPRVPTTGVHGARSKAAFRGHRRRGGPGKI